MQYLSRQDAIEEMRFLLLVKAILLKNTDQGAVGDFNTLMEKYNNLIQLKPKKTLKSKQLAEDMEAMRGLFGTPLTIKKGDPVKKDLSSNVETFTKKVKKDARRDS